MQIGPRHKVACHFAGELGHHPARPVTARLLGEDGAGRPDEAASPGRARWRPTWATPTPGSTCASQTVVGGAAQG